ncbi:hypothetical protein MTP09_02955 [Chryseobacterium suipulveris]|uniref:Ig-like domain-containing protein n=1 Tax=Chryseobacterium suipulveris TaxID=2929800 RepID=A0ABY4BTU0_9FLAO|nr:hypothetical protein [Chryseobacterium suipulveris]UOE41612.1 hypothetical protein MTP09_02955 [Chryseobacterium suipulveris]
MSGYTFTSTSSSNWVDSPAPTVTNSSVIFSSATTSTGSTPGNGYVVYNGVAVLPAYTNVVLTYTGQKYGTYNSSNENNGYAIALLPPCTTPATPTVTTTGATCTSAGTATISNYNSALTYTFSPSGPSVGAGGVISGLTAGTSYTVTATDGNCTATSTSFRVAAQLSVPTATVSSTSPICSGQNAVFTITGTPNAVVTYTLNGGANTNVTLSSTGTATVTVNGATANQTLTLVSVNNPTTKCSATLSGSSTVTVNPLPTATVSSTSPICSGQNAVFNITGTPNAVVTYNINGGLNTVVTLSSTGTGTGTVS